MMTIEQVRALATELEGGEYINLLTDVQIADCIRFDNYTVEKWTEVCRSVMEDAKSNIFTEEKVEEMLDKEYENEWHFGDARWDAPGMSVRDFIR